MMARLVVAGFILLLPFVSLAADTSEFIISVLGGDDSEAPSTPTLLSVDPVATSQIDVTWSVSTDNLQLEGYVLFRDGVSIATTTLTTYMDTGLASETLYEYEVYAYDSFGNISSTSNAMATTTLAPPVVPPAATSTDTTNPPSATMVFRLVDLNIVTARNSALLQFETSLPSRFALRWGRTSSYDDGFVINDTYQRTHRTIINELEPGTNYLFELVGYSPSGREVVLKRGDFTTTYETANTPANVRNLAVQVVDTTATLSWQMPTELNDSQVRIVRSHLGYPSDPYDGAVVYVGAGTSFVDTGALRQYETQYYTVFVIAADGSVSSGAVVAARKVPLTTPGTGPGTTTATGSLPSLPDIEIGSTTSAFGFSSEDIKLLQGNKEFTFKDADINLLSSEVFTIRIPYGALPDNLKSIIVTLLDPADGSRSYSFLLRINKDRTAYEATIAPLKVEGVTRLQVEIFDYERKLVGRYQQLLTFVHPEMAPEVIFPDKIIMAMGSFFSGAWLIFLAFLLILFLLYRRSKQTEDKL
ncbi:hypothetical protein A3I99_04405 [Candidatus Kaiserbacteria bacterium RIFCSPLOWO2_02_FULL_45_11b]|uniref:Fibronectin type-III domain-containing protein n=1 Tax=Candidatus Kaiserbacteria bacterium RIFCSPLOWO2_12_FULL_45_26 TaxID=1798525 RepID=A0A1F6FHH0_9BACT|nr:MAG: hypothetical protein A2929_03620 [Candidatus Kaiserbacteria bacterium RIFCSPLOWO2_01_FULL_45_25]OGG83820.1 MAG: hypothetical protein A3I99_04405 [Candidatus Kaiserbacteria bacterium RIFCSPLOWO2_02_FULL_45_11b]OGG85318.1 MAG: hypothetical protein A3G90_04680 [Candidatus Kaiserbacteria bacterium RIFCSPLOWO2_12_FULL_45_26]